MIFTEIVFGYLMLVGPAFHDRAELRRALVAYRAAPSPNTSAELIRQRQITRQQRHLIVAVFGLIFVGNSFALVQSYRTISRSRVAKT
ncbi:MAG TPA: hypothetical protein VIV82_01650 [Verrucomicrobiae bacterium]